VEGRDFVVVHPLGMVFDEEVQQDPEFEELTTRVIVVKAVEANSVAEAQGVKAGMVVEEINGVHVQDEALNTMVAFEAELQALQKKAMLTFNMSKEVSDATKFNGIEDGGDDHVFDIDVSIPLGMGIDHPKGDASHYPAVVTQLTPQGQAAQKGVQVGMHVHTINGTCTPCCSWSSLDERWTRLVFVFFSIYLYLEGGFGGFGGFGDFGWTLTGFFVCLFR